MLMIWEWTRCYCGRFTSLPCNAVWLGE